MVEAPRSRAVVLDFNNTIVDAFSAFAELDIAVARDMFGETITREDVQRLWGSHPSDMFRGLFRRPDTPWEDLAAVLREYRAAHADEQRFLPQAYPGAAAALQQLREAGLELCLATGGTEQVVFADMARNGIRREWFSHIQFPVEGDPKPLEPVAAHLGTLGIQAAEIAMVGDDMIDLVAARRAHLGRFVAVATGVTVTPQEFEQAGVPRQDIIAHIGELPALLLQ